MYVGITFTVVPLMQFLLVDLRCHGESASIKKNGPHTVAAAALDVLKLVGVLTILVKFCTEYHLHVNILHIYSSILSLNSYIHLLLTV